MSNVVGVQISSPPPPARRKLRRSTADRIDVTIGEEGEAIGEEADDEHKGGNDDVAIAMRANTSAQSVRARPAPFSKAGSGNASRRGSSASAATRSGSASMLSMEESRRRGSSGT